MTDPLTPAARVLLGRMGRSMCPWRAAGLPATDRRPMLDLIAGGLVELDGGIYRLTFAGRTALTPGVPS